jgi:hypothetical protein
LPAPRLKTNYDETWFQQLALEIQNAGEMRLAGAGPREHAAYHVERGRQMLKLGFMAEAAAEFRNGVGLDASVPGAQAGLAQALEKSDPVAARAAAQSALAAEESVEALLVLVRLDLSENHTDAAAREVDRALALRPQDTAALALKRTVDQMARKGSGK